MPLNRIEQYLGNLRGDGNTIPDKPLNRIEKYLAIMCGEDYEIPKPLNRIEQYLADIAENGGGGGGGGSATLITKTITSNGTYDASEDDADGYSEVTVSVPNSYAAGDEGKVVSNGALVTQTAATYTANSVYDTTLIDEVTVNVSGGGGGLTLLASDEVEVNTTSTTATEVKTINATIPTPTMQEIIVCLVYDKAGARNGQFYYAITRTPKINETLQTYTVGVDSVGGKKAATGNQGVYLSGITATSATISAKYSAFAGTVNGTYAIKLYLVDLTALM